MNDNTIGAETLQQLSHRALQSQLTTDAFLQQLLALSDTTDKANYELLFQEAPIAIWKQDFSQVKIYLDLLRDSGVTDIEAHLQTHPEAITACLALIKVTDANTLALKLYEATTVEQIQAATTWLFSHETSRIASLMALANNETSFSGEFANKNLAGENIHILLKWIAMKGHEQTYSEVIVATLDVTELKLYQQSIIENERLINQFRKEQEHNSLVQRSISTLSHDLRIPLAVISIAKDLLLKHFDKLTDEKRREKLESIGRQLELALELLDDTVMVVRGTLTDRLFRPVLVDLAHLYAVTVDEIGMSYNVTNRMSFLNRDAVKIALVDEILVSRILLNLLSNAIKYSPNGKEVRLELDRHDDQVVLRVVDDGMGIPADAMPHIFEPFYRAEEAQSISGTGLGLSIVKECVERHQGQIVVESEVGKGTTFTVKLPLLASTDRVSV